MWNVTAFKIKQEIWLTERDKKKTINTVNKQNKEGANNAIIHEIYRLQSRAVKAKFYAQSHLSHPPFFCDTLSLISCFQP